MKVDEGKKTSTQLDSVSSNLYRLLLWEITLPILLVLAYPTLYSLQKVKIKKITDFCGSHVLSVFLNDAVNGHNGSSVLVGSNNIVFVAVLFSIVSNFQKYFFLMIFLKSSITRP